MKAPAPLLGALVALGLLAALPVPGHSGGGPLSIVLHAPRAVVTHYALFAEPYEPIDRPPPQALIERNDDADVAFEITTPDPHQIYGLWYRTRSRE